MSEPVTHAVNALMARDASAGVTSALVVSVSDEIVVERYGVIPGNALRDERVVDATTPLLSWSVAKSVVHAIVGVLVADGLADLEAPIGLEGVARSGITWLDLLEMRSGLAFVEEYEIGQPSDCIEMLFSGDDAAGVPDMGEFAASRDVIDQPGRLWNYSSGSTNIVCRAIGNLLSGPVATTSPGVRSAAITTFVTDRVMGPLGIDDWSARFDASGTLIGSSFMFMSARSWVEFGELYRRAGITRDGQPLLPSTWRDHARTTIAHDADGDGPDGFGYGRHWWTWPHRPGLFAAHGFEGQFVLVWPEREITVAHFGLTPRPHASDLVAALDRVLDAVG